MSAQSLPIAVIIVINRDSLDYMSFGNLGPQIGVSIRQAVSNKMKKLKKTKQVRGSTQGNIIYQPIT